jgi:protein-S-isoprenylcysteine O-methyltransferase Ste14
MSIQRIWETFFKIKKKTEEIIDKWTLNVLVTIHVIIIIAAVAEYFIVKRQINLCISIIGFILYIIALIGRNWSINTLGKYHSPHVEIMDKHLLIRNGPYRYLRHPYYLSVIFEFIGFPLVPNSYYALCLSLFLYIPALYILRVYPEEKAMMREFGREYLLYKKEVGGFLPFKRS